MEKTSMVNERRVVVITGGAQGIGKGIAKKMLEEGFNVVIGDFDVEAGKETVGELKIGEGKIKFMEVDVSKEENIKNLVEFTMIEFGRIDVLVNNAGVFYTKPIIDLSLEEWNKIIANNLTSVFLCSKYAAPHLKKSFENEKEEGKKFAGSIINICSTRAFMSEPNTESYSASKGGIFALTHSLAASLGPQIRVNCISPGWIDCSEWKKTSLRHTPDLNEADHNQHPVGRVGNVEDISNMAFFLACPEKSGFITGQNFTIDGGMTKKMIYV